MLQELSSRTLHANYMLQEISSGTLDNAKYILKVADKLPVGQCNHEGVLKNCKLRVEKFLPGGGELYFPLRKQFKDCPQLFKLLRWVQKNAFFREWSLKICSYMGGVGEGVRVQHFFLKNFQ